MRKRKMHLSCDVSLLGNRLERVTAYTARSIYILQNLKYINLSHNYITAMDYMQNVHYKSLNVWMYCWRTINLAIWRDLNNPINWQILSGNTKNKQNKALNRLLAFKLNWKFSVLLYHSQGLWLFIPLDVLDDRVFKIWSLIPLI